MTFFRFPYTSFNQVNLDWIMKTLKKLEPAATMVEDAAATLAEAQAAAESAQETADEAAATVETVTAQASEAIETANEAQSIAQQTASALTNRVRNIVVIGDSYGLDTAGWIGWETAISHLISVAARSAVGGSGFVGDPNENTFLQQIQALTVADKNAVTDIVVLGGYNDASLNLTETTLNTAVSAFAAYCRENYPLAAIHYGFVAVDYNNTGKQATLNSYRYMFQRICSKAGISFIANAPYILLNKSLIYFADGDPNSGYHPNTAGGAEVARKIVEYLYSGTFDVIYGETLLNLTIYAKNGDVSVSPVTYSLGTILPVMTYPFNTWTLLVNLSHGSNLLWGTHDDATTYHFWAAVYTNAGLISHALFKIQDKGLYINPLNNSSGLTLSEPGWVCLEGMTIPMQTNY